jgi:hypothetical protein
VTATEPAGEPAAGPADEPPDAAGVELAVPDGPQAPKTRATAAMSEPTLDSLVRMVLLSMVSP